MSPSRWRVVLGADGVVLAAEGGAVVRIGATLVTRTDVPEPVRLMAAQLVAAVRDPARGMTVVGATVAGPPDVDLIVLEAIAMRRAEVALAPLLEDAIETLRRQAEVLDIALSVEAEADLPPLVALDPEKIAWVVATLVGNALRYVRRGSRWRPGGSVRVLLAHDVTRGELTITVADDGPGIPRSKLPYLFARAPGASRAEGVALMLIRDVIAAHGGHVSVDSRTDAPDHGTAVMIRLPTR